ncbi:uncharacterized protein LOC117640705 [Thrips palmi]|uniref:Uncharacterized protein LOC117640705 n=1 Tax=Thrips palmi TaxID=161013 RepID=A0A6P8YB03_THRPL|nr:uncharacterized protein LOC117640705 [Thrips palmi]XP_034233412.1 uncharacterized protein LOC117640705 [Thrips palmi]
MDRASTKDLPRGAVVMNRSEAIEYIWSQISKHKPEKEVIALKYGSLIAGGFASLSGFAMLRHFRSSLGLRKEASISSNLFCLFLPCMGTFIYHFLFVTPPILLQEKYCNVCLQLKSVAIQTSVGFLWPWGLAAMSSSMTATKLGVNMPTLMQPIELMKMSNFLAQQGKGPAIFTGLLVCNTLGAVLLVSAEESQILTFRRRIQMRRVLDQE